MALFRKLYEKLKNLIAIFLLATYLFSATELHQVLKLPVIFQHFAEHKKQNKQLTLLEFLDIHYMHGSPMDADHDRDMKLPFKTISAFNLALGPVITPDQPGLTIFSPAFIITNTFENTNDDLLPSEQLSSIYHPPRT